MRIVFQSKNGYLQSGFLFLMVIGIFVFFITISGNANVVDWSNPLILTGIGGILIILILLSNRGNLEIRDHLLVRKRFFISLWSVDISQISDILQGNTISNRYTFGDLGYSPRGLSFRDVNDNFYQMPYDIQKQADLIESLKIINTNITFHSDVTSFLVKYPGLNEKIKWGVTGGWKGNKRLKKGILLELIFVLVLWIIILIATHNL